MALVGNRCHYEDARNGGDEKRLVFGKKPTIRKPLREREGVTRRFARKMLQFCGMSIIRVPLWRRRWWKIEQFENFGIVHFFRPGSRCGPWLRVGFHGIGSAREKQLNHLNRSTPAGPPERSAFEELVTHVQASSGIEQHRRERHAYNVIARSYKMQHAQSVLRVAMMRPTTGKNQFEAFAAFGLLLCLVAVNVVQRAGQLPEPSAIVRRPVNTLKCHANDVNGTRAGAAP